MRHIWAASYTEVLPSDSKFDYGELMAAAVVPQWLTALVLVSRSDALATCPRRLADSQAETLNLDVLDSPLMVAPVAFWMLELFL